MLVISYYSPIVVEMGGEKKNSYTKTIFPKSQAHKLAVIQVRAELCNNEVVK